MATSPHQHASVDVEGAGENIQQLVLADQHKDSSSITDEARSLFDSWSFWKSRQFGQEAHETASSSNQTIRTPSRTESRLSKFRISSKHVQKLQDSLKEEQLAHAEARKELFNHLMSCNTTQRKLLNTVLEHQTALASLSQQNTSIRTKHASLLHDYDALETHARDYMTQSQRQCQASESLSETLRTAIERSKEEWTRRATAARVENMALRLEVRRLAKLVGEEEVDGTLEEVLKGIEEDLDCHKLHLDHGFPMDMACGWCNGRTWTAKAAMT